MVKFLGKTLSVNGISALLVATNCIVWVDIIARLRQTHVYKNQRRGPSRQKQVERKLHLERKRKV